MRRYMDNITGKIEKNIEFLVELFLVILHYLDDIKVDFVQERIVKMIKKLFYAILIGLKIKVNMNF